MNENFNNGQQQQHQQQAWNVQQPQQQQQWGGQQQQGMMQQPPVHMQMPQPQGPEYQTGYQQAVRDMSGGRSTGSQAAMALLNMGLFLGVPLYFLYRMNKGASGPGGSKMMSQMMEQMNPIQKRNFQVQVKDTKFKDVIGINEAKEEIQEYVDFLKNPKQYTDLGAKLPRGALLTGKPGTGKTLMAKAVAGESDVAFFSAGGSDFIEIFGGSGPKRVRELFAEAKKNSPAVIFIDELDAVGSKRSSGGDQGIGGEENRTTNALLNEMDGMTTDDTVVVFAATNHPEALDTALTRAGRFDRKINIPVPDEPARKDLFSYYLDKVVTANNFEEKAEALEKQRKETAEKEKAKETGKKQKQEDLEKLEKQLKELEEAKEKKPNQEAMEDILRKAIRERKQDVEVEKHNVNACKTPPTEQDKAEAKQMAEKLSERTPGITPATIATVVNEAAIVAARNAASFVKPAHVTEALDNVLIGKKHRSRMSAPALKRVAYHEAGHTLAQWMLATQSSVVKVSIVPRGRAGGYTQFKQREELDPQSQKFLTDQIVVLLGGRCAEKIFFNDYTTGAHDDLQRAYEAAQNQVQLFGMSPVGHFSIGNPQGEARGRAFSQVSESLKNEIEKEAREIVHNAFDDCMKMLETHKSKLEKIAEALLEKKEITEAEIVDLIGPKAVEDP